MTTAIPPEIDDEATRAVDLLIETVVTDVDSGEPFSHEAGVAELDVAIQTLASLALAVIRHGALAGGGA